MIALLQGIWLSAFLCISLWASGAASEPGDATEKKIRSQFSILERFTNEQAWTELETAGMRFSFKTPDVDIIRSVYRAELSHGELIWPSDSYDFSCEGREKSCRLRLLQAKTWTAFDVKNRIIIVSADNPDKESGYALPTVLGYILLTAEPGQKQWHVKTAVPHFTSFSYGRMSAADVKILLAPTYAEDGSVYKEAHVMVMHDTCEGLPEKRTVNCLRNTQLWWLDFNQLRQHLAVDFYHGVMEKTVRCPSESDDAMPTCTERNIVSADARITSFNEREIVLDVSYRSKPETGRPEAWRHQMIYSLKESEPHLASIR